MAKFDQILFESGFATGSTKYADYYPGSEQQNRIVLSVAPAEKKGIAANMILDTGSPWCIADPVLLRKWGILDFDIEYVPTARLHIRDENRVGHLIRATIMLQATFGDDLIVDTTFFVPILGDGESWNYPNFLGLSGFLDRIRFAVDPSENVFYFGTL